MSFQSTDQLGRTVRLMTYPPRRIVSLVPSQTELLHALGLDENVVGLTKFCIHPKSWYKSKTRVGGTKTLHLDRIEALQPDLIIGNKEENEKEQIEQLMERYPVWMSDIYTLSDALDMIVSLGELCGKSPEAQLLSTDIAEAFGQLPPYPTLRVAYFIWRKPYMVAAKGTFIQDMLEKAGFENVFADRDRYPEIRPSELKAAQPDAILLSSEPFPFKEKHFEEFREICPNAQIAVVDGEYFSWYGSRLQGAPAYFGELRTHLSPK